MAGAIRGEPPGLCCALAGFVPAPARAAMVRGAWPAAAERRARRGRLSSVEGPPEVVAELLAQSVVGRGVTGSAGLSPLGTRRRAEAWASAVWHANAPAAGALAFYDSLDERGRAAAAPVLASVPDLLAPVVLERLRSGAGIDAIVDARAERAGRVPADARRDLLFDVLAHVERQEAVAVGPLCVELLDELATAGVFDGGERREALQSLVVWVHAHGAASGVTARSRQLRIEAVAVAAGALQEPGGWDEFRRWVRDAPGVDDRLLLACAAPEPDELARAVEIADSFADDAAGVACVAAALRRAPDTATVTRLLRHATVDEITGWLRHSRLERLSLQPIADTLTALELNVAALLRGLDEPQLAAAVSPQLLRLLRRMVCAHARGVLVAAMAGICGVGALEDLAGLFTERCGTSPRRWQLAVTLAETWNGTVAQLLDAVDLVEGER